MLDRCMHWLDVDQDKSVDQVDEGVVDVEEVSGEVRCKGYDEEHGSFFFPRCRSFCLCFEC